MSTFVGGERKNMALQHVQNYVMHWGISSPKLPLSLYNNKKSIMYKSNGMAFRICAPVKAISYAVLSAQEEHTHPCIYAQFYAVFSFATLRLCNV